MTNLKIFGEAWINENPWFIKNPSNLEEEGYEPYYFIGNNKILNKEELEEIGKLGEDNILILSKGKNVLCFAKKYTQGITTSRILDWDNPMFILEKYSDGWSIRPNSEGEKYLE